MDTKSPSVRDNGLVRRFCAGRSRVDAALQVSDEQAAVLIEDAAFLVAFADMFDPWSSASAGLRIIAGHLRTIAGEGA